MTACPSEGLAGGTEGSCGSCARVVLEKGLRRRLSAAITNTQRSDNASYFTLEFLGVPLPVREVGGNAAS